MSSVETWFGPQFRQLHPALQSLHLHGGKLRGEVDIHFGSGPAGFLGKRLARKLGVPTEPGTHPFLVEIHHESDGLHWDRRFDSNGMMRSLFQPVGAWPDGYWTEETGRAHLQLTVDVVDGGWYWRCRRVWIAGIRIPLCLFPKTEAWKKFENGRYRFHVGLSLPLLGPVMSYGGVLELFPG